MAGGGSVLGLNHLDTEGVHHVPIEVNGKLFMQHGNETKVVGIRSTWLQLTHIEICSYLLISKGPTLEPVPNPNQCRTYERLMTRLPNHDSDSPSENNSTVLRVSISTGTAHTIF